MELDKATLFLVVGSSGLLTPTFYPANATNKNVSWSSSNQGVATVTNGIVLGVAAGRTTITATTEVGEFEATCAVTVVTNIPVVDGMVWISPGTFMMGSPFDEPESFDDEILHQVTLTEGFYMAKYPVTQKRWVEIMGYNDSIYPMDGDYYVTRWEEFPVENIFWYEAIVFCNLLSMDEGLSPAYTMYRRDAPYAGGYDMDDWIDVPENWSTNPADWGNIPQQPKDGTTRWDHIRVEAGSAGYRLPTEAQWEYACRAGTTTPLNTGNSITTDQANYNGQYPYNGEYNWDGVFLWQPIPVGMYAPSAWGLYDMHGNVSEWCWDWYGSYTRPAMPDTDPKGPDTGSLRVLRGGSFWDRGTFLRSACRDFLHPLNCSSTLGFRVIRPYSASSNSLSRAVGITRSRTTVPQNIRSFDKTDNTSASSMRLQATRREAVTVE
jgi:formylglycine-generating enzyme required for sulfatase activity